jgi:hypothetical protein
VKAVLLVYGLGVIAGSLVGFLSPLWYLGFIPLSAGLIWAAYDLVEVPRAESSTASGRRS